MKTVVVGAAVAAGAFAVSALCAAGFRRWASDRMLDIPNVRSSHTRPTPRGGGLGIVLSVFIGAWSLYFLRIPDVRLKEILALSFGGCLVALAGWLDDLHPLPYRARLAVHVISSAVILAGIGYFRAAAVPFFDVIRMSFLGIPLTLVWITGLTNAYNFMDGIDGIAGGQAVVAGLGWMLLGFFGGTPWVTLLGVILAAAGLGFLAHNWPPARIFMGDVASAFIGFLLAVLPVMAVQRDPLFMVAGFLVVWPFIFDTAFTMLRRMTRGENVFLAHRSHIYQRLVIAGYSHRFVALLYIGMASSGAVAALLWYKKAPGMGFGAIALPCLLFAGLWRLTVRAESRRGAEAQAEAASGSQRPAGANAENLTGDRNSSAR